MNISTVLFDLGGTLEEVLEIPEQKECCLHAIQTLLVAYDTAFQMEFPAFSKLVTEGFHAYKRWSSNSLIEQPGSVIWGQWIFKEYPGHRDLFVLLGDTLTDIWETSYYKRRLRPEARSVLTTLYTCGYTLGIISNTTSKRMPHTLLQMYGIADLFETVVLSAETGIRKPCTKIFNQALSELHKEAKSCVYVGDQPSRDARGPYDAKFATNLILSTDNTSSDPFVGHWIRSLSEIPTILERLKELPND